MQSSRPTGHATTHATDDCTAWPSPSGVLRTRLRLSCERSCRCRTIRMRLVQQQRRKKRRGRKKEDASAPRGYDSRVCGGLLRLLFQRGRDGGVHRDMGVDGGGS